MAILDDLREVCSIRKDSFDCAGDSHILTFRFDEAVTTVRICLKDYTGAHLVITHMTTLPDSEVRKGYGRQAIRHLLEAAIGNNLRDIRAVQVMNESEGFWSNVGFKPLRNITNDFVFET